MVLTKTAVRVYETKQKALSTYGKPIIAIPLAAVRKVERIKFDLLRDDIRFEGVPESDISITLTKNMFEFLIKDEFLPIYTHHQYTKCFKDTSITMELSPDKRKSVGRNSQMSPPYKGTTSTMSKKSSVMTSPNGLRSSHVLDMHKKTGTE